jgi:ribosomal-protein-alanine N-acetyltransferase
MIRPAVRDDLAWVLAIEQSSPAAAHWTRPQYEAAVEQPERLFLIAEQEGSLAGFMVAFIGTAEWELENIAVLPSARRCGIGRSLLRALVVAAERAGATEVRQEIRASNQAAQQLGQRAGFMQDGRRRGYYHDPQEDALLFKYLVKGRTELGEDSGGGSEKFVKNR